MSTEERFEEFPRDDLLRLLQEAQRVFATEQDRRNLLAGLGLAATAAQRPRGPAVRPVSAGPRGSFLGFLARDLGKLSDSEFERNSKLLLDKIDTDHPEASARRESLQRLFEDWWRKEKSQIENTESEKKEAFARDAFRAREAFRALLPANLTGLSGSSARDSALAVPEPLGDDLLAPEDSQPVSPAQFAAELVEMVARPSTLDVAISLARRAITEVGMDAVSRWQPLLDQLAALQRSYRIKGGVSPDVAGYREWLGFDCRHQYSLSDRFIGRGAHLRELDEWIADGAGISVRCIWALGGGGKSALAWYWLSQALTATRHAGYQGAFWCSFYEKNFNFDEFLRRALIFAAQMDEQHVRALSRPVAEERLLDVMEQGRFVFVLDGLERLMNGYAAVADRAVDLESLAGTLTHGGVSRTDRRMTDPRDGAFLRRLAREQAARVLITTRLIPADLEQSDGEAALPHVVLTELPGLTAADASELWTELVPSAEITQDLRAVFLITGYHPLVISILARSVAHFGGSWEEWRQHESHRDFNPREATTEAARRSHIIGVCLRDLPEESYDVLGMLTATGKPMRREELADVLLLGSRVSGDGRWVSEEQVSTQLQSLLGLGLIGAATPPEQPTEYDVHPVVRGAAWNLLTDPRRERFLDHALSEFAATPDRRGAAELDDLNKAIGLYRLLAQSGQTDRAWEMFRSKLWDPLFYRHSENRLLLDLYGLLLPNREVLQLLPLTSRRAQGDATGNLGDLLMRVGDGPRAKILLRWCGAIRLQIGDLDGFLFAAHSRAWQTMYEGRLFETEFDLRRLRLQTLTYGAFELRPVLDCWIGIILALRGEKAAAQDCFERARGRAESHNWWVQGLAEGLVYLDEADEALKLLATLETVQDRDEPTSEVLQVSWEKLTEGMTYVKAGNYDRATDALSAAYTYARQKDYAIVQCFALPCLAEIALDAGRIDEAEDRLAEYRELDPNDNYALCAAEASRVRSRCQLARHGAAAAQTHAAQAYALAACDGPPFCYQTALDRAFAALQQAGAYVPRTHSRLDPLWRKRLQDLAARETEIAQRMAGLASAPHEVEPLSLEEALAILEDATSFNRASQQDRVWWEDVTGAHRELKVELMAEMKRSQISLAELHRAFAASPHKSLVVAFHRVQAERLIKPEVPRPVHGLSESERTMWLNASVEHRRTLEVFLQGDMVRRIAQPFDEHHFDEDDITAFLKDHKRRIEWAADATAKNWWTPLERTRPARDMLLLAECVLRMPAKLAEVVAEIAIGTEQGLTYAFYALLTRRAIDRFESRPISRTEGWTPVEVLLRLQDVKQQIGWTEASAEARAFWEKLESDNAARLRQVLQLAEELRRRDATLASYHEAYLASNTENIQANLAYLDYQRLRRQRWDATQPWPADAVSERWAYETIRPRFTDTSVLSTEQIAGRVEVLLQRLGRAELAEDQSAWWERLRAAAAPAVLLRLAEELDVRRSSVASLRGAQIDADTENIIAALAYLDCSLLKGGEERRATQRAAEHNRVGNDHYENKRFREAVQSYEEAVKLKPAAVYFTNLAGAWARIEDIDPSTALNESLSALQRGLAQFPESSELAGALAAAELRRRLTALGGLPRDAASLQMLPVVTPVAMEVAADLIPLAEAQPEDDRTTLIARMPEMRDRILNDTGIRVPGVRFRGNEADMPPGSYLIMLDEVPIVMGTVSNDKVLARVAGERLVELGIGHDPATDPLDDREAYWIAAADAARLDEPVWDAAEYMVRHLEAVIRRHLYLFAGMQEVVNRLEETWSPAARQIASNRSQVERFTRMTKALLDEQVPMTAFEPICQAFLENCEAGGGMDELLRIVRMLPEIRPVLPGNRAGFERVELDPTIELELAANLIPVGDEHVLGLTPEYTQELLSAVRTTVGSWPGSGAPCVLVVRDGLRRYVRKLIELEFPKLFTLTTAELLEEQVGPVRSTITLG